MTTAGQMNAPGRWMVGVGLASMLVPLNSTMIAVALPTLSDDLGVARGTAGLLITIYLLVMLMGQPIAGRLADSFGTRRTVAVALAGFAVLSLATSFAGSFWMVVAGRSLQAVFGAGLMPGTRAMLRLLTAEDRRGRSFGMQESLIGVGAAAGPLAGGVVTEIAGWQGVFLVNIPIAVVAMFLLRDVPTGKIAPSAATTERSSVFDVLTERVFGLAFVTQAATVLGQYSLLLVIPVVLDSRGWSSTAIGAAVMLLTVGLVVMGPIGGQMGDRRGRRLPVMSGVTVAALGLGIAAIFIDSSMTMVLLAVGAFGVGFGLVVPNLTTAALGSVPEHLAGSASGIWSMSRYVGSIPASLLFAALVDKNVDRSRLLLFIACAVVTLAISVSSQLPGSANRHAPASH